MRAAVASFTQRTVRRVVVGALITQLKYLQSMEIAIENALAYLDYHDLAKCENVCKSWLNIINNSWTWRILCYSNFKITQDTIAALQDTEKEIDWPYFQFTRSNPIKHLSKLNFYDYVAYFKNSSIQSWKRFYLLLSFLFACAEDEDYQGIFERIYKLYDDEDADIELLSTRLAQELVGIFLTECKSMELDAIIENYFIRYSLDNLYNPGPLFPLIAQQLSRKLLTSKRKKGYKITKESTDPISLMFRHAVSTETNVANYAYVAWTLLNVVDKEFALERYNELFMMPKGHMHDFEREQWDELPREVLAHLGAPIAISPAIDYSYYTSEFPIFESDKDKEKEEEKKEGKESMAEIIAGELGINFIVAHLLQEELTSGGQSFSPKLIEDFTKIVTREEEEGCTKMWALSVIVTNEEFYNWWRSTPDTISQITNFLICGLTCKTKTLGWFTRRVAQRVIVGLGKLHELDLEILRTSLEELIKDVHLKPPRIDPDFDLVEDGNTYYWALLVLIQLGLGDKERNIEVGKKCFVEVPGLPEQLRNDILKFHGSHIRPVTHPCWLIECTIKGIEFEDTKDSYWTPEGHPLHIEASQSAIDCKTLQNKILSSISGKIAHKGFCHSNSLYSNRGFGFFYGLIIAPSSSGDVIELLISEVGPYARLRVIDVEHDPVPVQVIELPRDTKNNDEIIGILRNALKENFIMEVDQQLCELISNFAFAGNFGEYANNQGLPKDYLFCYLSQRNLGFIPPFCKSWHSTKIHFT